MDRNILQQFLDVGLFDIGDDDERLKIFHDAATDLAKSIGKEPQKAVSLTLVAIDPSVPDEDPVLEEAEAAVREHWNAFRNKYSERPKGLLRPVVLEALEKASTESAEIASAIWLVGVNLLPHLEGHKERELVKEFLDTKGARAEAEAEKIWTPDSQVELTIPKVAIKLGDPAAARINGDELASGMTIAAGGNPYWPHQNPQAWHIEFGKKSAEAIASAIAPLAGQAAIVAEQLEPALKKFGKELNGAVSAWVTNAVDSVRQRSELLWWKEALYSLALRSSYRGLSPVEVAVTMAHDLHNICAVQAPQSVEYFLRETVKAVQPQNQEASVAELLDAAHRSTSLAKVLQPVTPPASARRVCLLTSLSLSRNAILPATDLPAWLGVRGELKLPISELAVWLFRDAQALSLTGSDAAK